MLHLKFPITRASEDALRCNGIVAGRRQCNLTKVPSSNFCPIHGGNKAAESAHKKSLYKFRLDQYNARFTSLTGSDSIKDLRDEIAILRMLMQKRFDSINSTNDLLMHSTQFSKLVRTIASLSESCATIEKKLNDVMDKTSAVDLVATLLNALPVISDDLYSDITELLASFNNVSEISTSNLKLAKWADSLQEFLTTERVVSVRSEIGVLRIILEEKLNSCNSETDLILQSNSIIDTVQDIQTLVLSCHRLEQAQGILLTADQSKVFAERLIAIVAERVAPEVLKGVADVFEAYFSHTNS